MIETTIENGVQQFVHIICAIIHSKTRFLDPEKRRRVFRPPPKWLIPESPTRLNNNATLNSSILLNEKNETVLEFETKNETEKPSFSSTLLKTNLINFSLDFNESKYYLNN